MVSFPHCKINLGLNVIAKRPDGFHEIETCFYPIPWNDILEVIPSEKLTFTTSGLFIPGRSQDNLCAKAYELLKKEFDLPPVHIHLHKLLPTGAGLGGGSSDAAFLLRMINEMFKLHLSDDKLVASASTIGSDCAFFSQDNPMVGTGRGEILNPIQVSLKGKFVVLIKPDIHVATTEAFSGIVPRKSTLSIKEIVEKKPIESWRELLINDFEKNIFKKNPEIGEVKKNLYKAGAVYASMSGSGSSVFGFFNHAIDLKSKFAGMSYWSGAV